MSNFWQKKSFCTCKPLWFLILLFSFSSSFNAQNRSLSTEITVHLVSTYTQKPCDPKFINDINNYFKSHGQRLKLIQHVHTNFGKFDDWQMSDSLYLFSKQMRACRDGFFNSSHSKSSRDFYVFLLQAEKASFSFFSLPGKNICFVNTADDSLCFTNFKKAFNKAAFPQFIDNNSTTNLDSSIQISINRNSSADGDEFHLFHDDAENSTFNNGLVAYYFWALDDKGDLVPFETKYMSRPFKKNFGKLNMSIDSFWLKPFYVSENRCFAPIHLALVSLAFLVMLMFRKKVNAKLFVTDGKVKKIKFFFIRLLLWILFFAVGYGVYLTTDSFYKDMLFNSSDYDASYPVEVDAFISNLQTNAKVMDHASSSVYSEVYILKNGLWKMQRMGKVLYFKVRTVKGKDVISFHRFSNRISIKGYDKEAETHLFVYSHLDNSGNIIKEDVYNYDGIRLNERFLLKDHPKRIVLFVNGYRPVSDGGDFTQNLMKMAKNGVEYPNSNNHILANDRFDYWTPSNEFNLRFIERIKPQEIFYADGHHSVATSNHTSAIKFATLTQHYPKVCNGKHHCNFDESNTEKRISTLSNLPFHSNLRGFELRKNKGKIAGQNLLQLLNEIPNSSKNDTLFMVAHSMGYAYALGMLEVLKGKINLGSFYIFAPENADAGKIDFNKWQTVYQYGSIPFGSNCQAPCLQDGIAPQQKVIGLPDENRLTFPKSYYEKMGFAGSHYIGNFDWVFDIPEGQSGAVKQH